MGSVEVPQSSAVLPSLQTRLWRAGPLGWRVARHRRLPSADALSLYETEHVICLAGLLRVAEDGWVGYTTRAKWDPFGRLMGLAESAMQGICSATQIVDQDRPRLPEWSGGRRLQSCEPDPSVRA